MQNIYDLVVSRFSPLKDASKLCFSAAAGFAAFALAGAMASYWYPGIANLDVISWISVFYLVLGLVEQWSPARSETGRLNRPAAAVEPGPGEADERPLKLAA